MGIAGDLHWERVSAGNYRTMFWANGYRYKIEKDDYYANTWHVWYKWDKWTDKKKWVKLTRGYGSTVETLKAAKRNCTSHNLRPRRKFKFIKRMTAEDVGTRYGMSRYLGFLKFQEVDREGKIFQHTAYYMNPKEIGGIDPEEERRQKEIADLNRMLEV